MITTIFQFGKLKSGYPVPLLNERTVRAVVGVLFLFALISFMNAWLVGNLFPNKVFVRTFLVEFTIRIFINTQIMFGVDVF